MRHHVGRMLTGLRFAVGTLSVIPARAPMVSSDGHAANDPAGRLSVVGWAMVWAPLVGLLLGALALAGASLLVAVGGGDLLGAIATVAILAVGTRGLHLDGLADTADGLGSGGDREHATRVMKASDIGPFGVVTLVLVLLAQVAAITRSLGAGDAALAVPLAAGVGRLAVVWACRPRVPAARPTGLGALVAGRVPTAVAASLTVVALLAAAGAGMLAGIGPWRPLAAVALGLLAAEALSRHAVRRLGGVTGDVLGALVETASTVVLVVLATAG